MAKKRCGNPPWTLHREWRTGKFKRKGKVIHVEERNPELMVINPKRRKRRKSARRTKRVLRNYLLKVQYKGKLRTSKALRSLLGSKLAAKWWKKHSKYHGKKLVACAHKARRGKKRTRRTTKHSRRGRKHVRRTVRHVRRGHKRSRK